MKSTPIALGIAIIASGAIFSFIYFGESSLVAGMTGDATAGKTTPSDGLIGSRLPYFDLSDLAGDRVRSSDFADTPLVIVFWSTWNEQSADEMHIIDQYIAGGSTQSALVKIIAIDSQEERSVVSSFMSRGGYRVRTLLDARGIASERYGIKGLPAFYFADGAGVVREAYVGMLNQSTLTEKIEKLLK